MLISALIVASCIPKEEIPINKPIEKALYILLGAFLSIIGGFLHQLYQSYLTTKRNDRDLFFQAEDILIAMLPIMEIPPANQAEFEEPNKRLLSAAMRIRARRNLDLAEKLVEFSRKLGIKSKDDTIHLIKEIAKQNRSALHRFHKKEDELFRKVAEELRKQK